MVRNYSAFGLRIRSEIALPELPADVEEDQAATDVSIELREVAARHEGAVDLEPLMQIAADRFQLDTPAGRYLMLGARRIIVYPRPGASARDVRLYLLGTVMGALCYGRSRLPLHANVIEAGDGAVAFAGPSGAGKSTLAAQFLRRGRAVMADDLCAVDLDAEGAPRAYPGLARIKLWGDSLALAGLEAAALPRIADDVEKFSLGIPARTRARPLRRLYLLRPGTSQGAASRSIDFRRLAGPEAVDAVLASLYRWPMAIALGAAPRGFALCVALARACDIFELSFVHDAGAAEKLPDALDAHMDP